MAFSAPRVIVPIADGTEDIELSAITDVLTRAGAVVTTASVMPGRRSVTLARNLKVESDILLDGESSMASFDAILVPGGMPGSLHIAECSAAIRLLTEAKAAGQLYGAICAAPAVVLGPNGLLDGVRQATCFPALKEKLPASTVWCNRRVVRAGNCLTSQGPGTAIEFALCAVSALFGAAAAKRIASQLLVEFEGDGEQRCSL
jgi:4-methyl-5(b-hydroxyethyl)-thiazole monophosphate biosynthesis